MWQPHLLLYKKIGSQWHSCAYRQHIGAVYITSYVWESGRLGEGMERYKDITQSRNDIATRKELFSPLSFYFYGCLGKGQSIWSLGEGKATLKVTERNLKIVAEGVFYCLISPLISLFRY